MDKLLTYAETAERLSVSVRTVKRMADDGRLERVHVTDRAPRIRGASVERHLSSAVTPRDAA